LADWHPDIYEYLDYRKFLTDAYHAGKENLSAFSYRYLARRAGFSSPNFIKLVMDGKRNLGGDSPERVAQAFDLDEHQTRFFLRLVALDQAETNQERNAAYRAVAASRRFRAARRIEHDMFEYLSHWYYPAIREMAARDDFVDDAKWIAERLFPSVPTRDVQRALEALFRLGLLTKDDDGTISRGEPSVTTGHEVAALAARNFHYQMLERARESIELCDREFRDVSALTVCVNPDVVDQLKDRVHRFREEMLDLCDSSSDPETVYQLNIQLFPLTRPPE
jgi:uncharacterized protein (TIGR02147 family)